MGRLNPSLLSFQVLTGSLQVLQFELDTGAQGQSGLAAGDHGSSDDAQWATSHSLPGFSQEIQSDGVRIDLTHLETQNMERKMQKLLK